MVSKTNRQLERAMRRLWQMRILAEKEAAQTAGMP